MARLIKDPVSPQTPKVDWAKYAKRSGRWWLLEAGSDFYQDAHRASRAARQWASNHGFHCSANFPGNGNLQIRFERKAEPR